MTATLLLGMLLAGTRQSPAAVRTVLTADLERNAGDWCKIARYPNRFQCRYDGDARASCDGGRKAAR